MALGLDAVLIYLAARDDRLFWVYPLLATAGSLAGAAITFWIGHRVGEVGVARLVHLRRLERFRGRLRDRSAAAMALPALLPPPFPLTAFILTCGALAVDRWWFFAAFGAGRLLRFGTEAALARVYGRDVLRVIESGAFQFVLIAVLTIALIGTLMSALLLWRSLSRRAAPA